VWLIYAVRVPEWNKNVQTYLIETVVDHGVYDGVLRTDYEHVFGGWRDTS